MGERETVVVTGGTGALGTSVTEALLADGWSVCVPAVQPAGHRYLTGWRLKDHPRVSVVPGVDLASDRSVRDFYASVEGLWASVHVAGAYRGGPICETTVEDLRFLLDVNVVTAFLCCREAARALLAAGGGGRIVNVSARPALTPAAGLTAYAATKSAVGGLTRNLAEELREQRIWVNAVVPSIMDTPANRAAMPGADHGSWPSTADVASAVAFLVSRGNAVVTGALVPVSGRT